VNPAGNSPGQVAGATYFAEHLSELYGDQKPVSAVTLNGVCDKNLKIYKASASVEIAPMQVEALWNIGREINSQIFQNQTGPRVQGNDIPLDAAGIPTVAIGGFELAGGKTHNACSAQSMEAVAQALMKYVLQIAPTSVALP
jgi:hypothetical protein